jgi:hypothetical protein
MRVSDIFEGLIPRVIDGSDESCRYIINGYFYDPNEAMLMDLLLRHYGITPHWYKRKARVDNEIILQISGLDVEKLLRAYEWKDKKKKLVQIMILRELEYRQNVLVTRASPLLQGEDDDEESSERGWSIARR